MEINIFSQDEAFFEVIAPAIAKKNNDVLAKKIIGEMFKLFFTRYLVRKKIKTKTTTGFVRERNVLQLTFYSNQGLKRKPKATFPIISLLLGETKPC